jgi:hypothetical protein
MKNLTISMDEDLYSTTRVEAAKAGLSMSRYLAQAAREKNKAANENQQALERNLQLEAVERFLSGPKLHISENGRMPTAEERNARR